MSAVSSRPRANGRQVTLHSTTTTANRERNNVLNIALHNTMSTPANSYYFRRRTMGRAASPPTWACYEQIHDDGDYSDSDSDSCSEDDEDYADGAKGRHRDSDSEPDELAAPAETSRADNTPDIDNMDIDADGPQGTPADGSAEKQKDVKGKQRAIEPEPETPRRQRKPKRQHVYTLRPILTIQRSQGFVWNQVCLSVVVE